MLNILTYYINLFHFGTEKFTVKFNFDSKFSRSCLWGSEFQRVSGGTKGSEGRKSPSNARNIYGVLLANQQANWEGELISV